MSKLQRSQIKKLLSMPEHGNVALVSPETSPATDPARNIFLLDEYDQVLWQIESSTNSHGVVGYNNIFLGKSSELRAYSSNGIEYSIDISNGKIISKELIR